MNLKLKEGYIKVKTVDQWKMIVCNSRIVFKMENLSSSYLQVFYKNEMLKMVDPIDTTTWEYLDL